MSPGSYYIDQIDLELGDPPASVFLTLGLKGVYHHTPLTFNTFPSHHSLESLYNENTKYLKVADYMTLAIYV